MKSLSVKLGVILIGLAIFAYVEKPWAESAWVLWENLDVINEEGQVVKLGQWVIVNAYPRHEQCLEGQKQKFLNYKEEQGYKVISIPFGYVWRYKEGGKSSIIQELKCLPDTIDPRK